MNDFIKQGDYVIVKKQNFKKFHKVSENSILTMGKEQIQTKSIVGKAYWTTFNLIPSADKKGMYTLQPIDKVKSLNKLIFALPSGFDNRSINDDGTSQQLSKEEISKLRKAGKSSKEIVNTLIENSTTFSAKTEYSQEKYIRKKEKKYFQYLTICKPTIQLLQEIYFHQDYMKINSLRIDTLSQILSYCDIKSDGIYLLYDSGSSGLPAASMLSRIGCNTCGSLINFFPGNEPQTTIIQAMNFSDEQLNRLINISMANFIKNKVITENFGSSLLLGNESSTEKVVSETSLGKNSLGHNQLKRRRSDSIGLHVSGKKSRMSFTVDLLNSEKAEGLVLIVKEHPLKIFEILIPFVKKSRPFVIFHLNREPLQDTYVVLRQKYGVLNVRLFSTFLRSHQVLRNRTHPDILTNNSSGYILTGYLIP